MTVFGWSDVVCEHCTSDILTWGWQPRHHSLLTGDISCPACKIRVGKISESVGGAFDIRPWRNATPAEQQDRSARHEAAHAVVGERLGMIANATRIGDQPTTLAGGAADSTLGGTVDFDFPEGGIQTGNLAAALHAGWASDRAWLRRHGADTPANRLDAAFSSVSDMEALAGYFTDPDAHIQAVQDTDALIVEHEREIDAVRGELMRHRHLGRDAVRAAMDLARSSSSTSTRAPSRPTQPQTAPATGESTTTSNNTTGGTTAMSIDEIRAAIAEAENRNSNAASQLAAVRGEVDSVASLLQQITQGTGDHSVTEAVGAEAGIGDEVEQLAGRLGEISTQLMEYAGRL